MLRQKQPSSDTTPSHKWKSILSFGIAALACPCHLPIVLGLLAGTTLGGWLIQHTLVVTLAMLGIFVLALLYGVRTFRRWQGVSLDHREPEGIEIVAKSAREQ